MRSPVANYSRAFLAQKLSMVFYGIVRAAFYSTFHQSYYLDVRTVSVLSVFAVAHIINVKFHYCCMVITLVFGGCAQMCDITEDIDLCCFSCFLYQLLRELISGRDAVGLVNVF